MSLWKAQRSIEPFSCKTLCEYLMMNETSLSFQQSLRLSVNTIIITFGIHSHGSKRAKYLTGRALFTPCSQEDYAQKLSTDGRHMWFVGLPAEQFKLYNPYLTWTSKRIWKVAQHTRVVPLFMLFKTLSQFYCKLHWQIEGKWFLKPVALYAKMHTANFSRNFGLVGQVCFP